MDGNYYNSCNHNLSTLRLEGYMVDFAISKSFIGIHFVHLWIINHYVWINVLINH